LILFLQSKHRILNHFELSATAAAAAVPQAPLTHFQLFAHIKELGHAALKDVPAARAKGKK
jgi:hypothetical protein